MHDVAELALVLDQRVEAVEIAAGAVLDQRAPEIDQLLGRRRRRQAGQPLAHHQRQRLLDRRVGALGDLVELAAVEALVEHGGEVLGDAVHAARADRLDARLLDRLEHRARLLAGRLQAAMQGVVVAGEPQRDRIGIAAHDRRLVLAELARRLRQPHLAAHQAGPFGGEIDLQLRLARQRAHAAGHRALERLGGRFLGRGFRFDVGGHVLRSCARVLASVIPAKTLAVRAKPANDRLRAAPRSPRFPAVRRRSSADRTRPRSAAPARRTCSGR